jgi:HlyD family secretion protein
MNKTYLIILLWGIASACNRNDSEVDASGSFEASEIVISAESAGVIRRLDLQEGMELKAGEEVGLVDTVQLFLKKKQLLAQVKSTLSQKPDIGRQLASLQVQLQTAEREQKRIASLLKADAATPRQMDDANAQVEMIRRQIEAQSSSLGISSGSISQQANPLQVQVEQVQDQLDKCHIINPVNGTVLSQYAEAGEMTGVAKPLYKIADLSTLVLRAYVTGTEFSTIKLNQMVKVLVDAGDGKYREYKGTIEWISSKAEFTPKTIQTKDERANLVYAVKIRVKNDGLLKIGMYADIKF